MSGKISHLPNSRPATRLNHQWRQLAILWLALLAATAAGLHSAWPGAAWPWLAMAGLLTAYSLWLIHANLADNRRPDEVERLPFLGAGAYVTIGRGMAISLLAGFLLLPPPPGWLAWLPALFYALAALLDVFDGYAARRTNSVTLLGARLDMAFDALGILTVIALAVIYGILPWWYMAVGLARYLFVAGLWYRQRRGWPVVELPPSRHRRFLASAQMGFLAIIIWPVWPEAGTRLAAIPFFLSMMAGFGRDWLFVSGQLPVKGDRYRQFYRLSGVLLRGWLPLLLRGVVVAAALWLLSQGYMRPAGIGSWLLLALLLAGVMAVALGAAGRIGSLLPVPALAAGIATWGLNLPLALFLLAALSLTLLGTGYYSLWQPEERWIFQPLGERPATA